jgi:hypothetical protein
MDTLKTAPTQTNLRFSADCQSVRGFETLSSSDFYQFLDVYEPVAL